jgi:hypothetical protein
LLFQLGNARIGSVESRSGTLRHFIEACLRDEFASIGIALNRVCFFLDDSSHLVGNYRLILIINDVVSGDKPVPTINYCVFRRIFDLRLSSYAIDVLSG